MSVSAIHTTPVILGLIFLVNLPFGYWRAGVRKLSRAWFVAIHAPVVLAIGMRLLAGIPFRLVTLPLFVLAFFAGQLIGGKARALFVAAVIAAALAAAPAPLHAGYTSLSATVEELSRRQSVGIESVLFGDRTLVEPHGQSVAANAFIGVYGSDGILSGVAASWRTSRLLPWEVGVGAAFLDLDVNTWTFVISSRSRVWSGGRSAVALEGALGYQFMTERSGDATFIRFEEVDPTGAAPTEFLIDSFHLFHAMVGAVYTTRLWILCPVVDVGWVGTTYRLDGNEWDGGLPPAPGASRRADGGVSKVAFGLGAALDVPRAILFGGMKVIDDAAIVQATLGFDF